MSGDMIQRPRARYRNNFGPMGFANPGDGPLERINLCVLDRMLHIFLRYSPFEQDKNAEGNTFHHAARKISQSSYQITGVYGGCPSQDGYISMWNHAEIDLDDMVQIMEGVPELQAAWLRAQLNEFKSDVALLPDDLAFLDSDVNHTNNSGSYTHSWYSAKGGKLYFRKTTADSVLKNIQTGFINAGASTSQTSDNSLKFAWQCPKATLEQSRNRMRSIIDILPGAIRAL